MTRYEIIDTICDSVNPLLLLLTLIVIAVLAVRGPRKRAATTAGFLVYGMVVVYGIFYLDSAFDLWSRFGGDYSTHTAFAVAVSVALGLASGRRWELAGLVLVYGMLMLYQQYHSLFDLVSTFLVITALLTPAVLLATRAPRYTASAMEPKRSASR